MKNEWKEFYDKAVLLGHDITALEKGAEEVRFFTFATMEEGRRLLSVANETERVQRQQSFFNPPIAARQRLGQGKHDRGEAILFANGAFLDGDEQGVGNHLPARIKAVSMLEKRIPAGTTWDISVRGAVWGIDDLEELYTTINIGRLILEPGARIIVRGNVCSMLFQEVIIWPGTDVADDMYHIGILPTPFSVDLKHGPMNGPDGITGMPGVHGYDGLTASVSSSMIGYMLMQEIEPDRMNGLHGADGADGTDATDGRNGGMCKIAEITVRHMEGTIRLFSQAGDGGHGGDGGDGGDGGNGGDGSRGYQLISGLLPAGTGGNGGHGGNGGRGGHGGNGGLSSNIYINVPATQEDQVHCLSLPSSGGMGGHGGKAGSGGTGGNNGREPGPRPDGQRGKDGLYGKPGKNGRSRPGAYIFLNEVCVQGELEESDIRQ